MAYSDMVIDGGDILLEVDGKTIGCATSHSIEVTSETRDTSCKGSGDWSSVEYSRLAWSGSTDVLFNLEDSGDYVRYTDLWDLLVSKTVITITSTYSEGDDEFVQTGEAVIASISKTAGDKENATFSVSFTGRGALGIVGRDLYYLNVTATGADFIVIEELNKIVSYNGSGVNSIAVKESEDGYTVTAFSSSGAAVGSTTVASFTEDTDVTVTVA
jgi:hypothetical protein